MSNILYEKSLNYEVLFCWKNHLMVIMEIKAVLPLSLADFRILNKTVGENTLPNSGQLKEEF